MANRSTPPLLIMWEIGLPTPLRIDAAGWNQGRSSCTARTPLILFVLEKYSQQIEPVEFEPQ